jgi:hypothetical protein
LADSGRRTKERWGSFHLGACHDGLGAGLGELYEAWREDTGAPVLLVRPGANVDWQPEGPLQVQLRFHPAGSTVSVETEAPTPPDLSEVVNLLVLTTAAVTRVEEHPQVRAHVASRPRTAGSVIPSLRKPLIGRDWRLAGLVGLAIGACVWLCLEWKFATPELHTSAAETEPDAMALSGSTKPGQATLAYPLPARPFRNQAIAPCYPQLDEVEINGGCWTTLKRRPPCLKDVQAEYKGECYLPISKDRDRGDKPAQSLEP